MPLRNVILRLMLWFLGLAALTGVVSVFVQRGTFIWRVIGTELCAALACALFLPCISMIDREKTRAEGLLGMIGVVVEFVLGLLLIWELPSRLWGVSWEPEIAGTMLCLGLAVLVAMPLLTLTHLAAHSVTAWTGLAVDIVAAGVFLVAIWCGAWGTRADKWAQSGAALTVTGALASVCLIGLGDAPRRHWRWAGVAGACGAATMWLYDIWLGSDSDLGFAVFTGQLALAAVVGFALVCVLCPLRPTQDWFRGATIAAGALTAALIELYVLHDRKLIRGLDEFWFERCTAASGIVTACGALALAVVVRLNRRVDFEPDSGSMTEIVVVCPRCRTRQSLPIGEGTCRACQLRISIRVEEPRCPTCDYLLIGLTSDRCPECGTAIERKEMTRV